MSYNERVLVTCPTFAGKEGALEPWASAFEALRYPPDLKFAFMVDNTGAGDGMQRAVLKRGIPCARILPSPTFEETYRRCWELILQRAKELDCYWIFSVEADNVVAPDSLLMLLDWAVRGVVIREGEERLGGIDQNVHIVSHGYPMHESAAKASGVDMKSFRYNEMGCTLLTRQVLDVAMAAWPDYRNVPRSLFEVCDKNGGKHIYVDFDFEVKHLDTYATEFWQFRPQDTTLPGGETLINPCATAPADYGTVLPKCLEEASHETAAASAGEP